MEFIIASISFTLMFAWQLILMVAALALAAYILAAIVELCSQLLDAESRRNIGVHTLRDMHTAGMFLGRLVSPVSVAKS